MSSSFPHYASYTSPLLATSPSHRSSIGADVEALKARSIRHGPPPPHLSHGSHGQGSSSSLATSPNGRGREEDRSFVLDEESLLFPDTSPVREGGPERPASTSRYGSTLEGRRASHGAITYNEVGARGRFRREAASPRPNLHLSTDLSPSSLASPSTLASPQDDHHEAATTSSESAGESGLTIRGRRPSVLPRALEPLVLLAEQGGETAEEEEERVLGGPGGGDGKGEAHRDWKLAVKVSRSCDRGLESVPKELEGQRADRDEGSEGRREGASSSAVSSRARLRFFERLANPRRLV